MPKVRTRMQPDVVIDVPEEEVAVLAACGLLADDPKPAPAATPAPAAPSAKAADQPPAAKPNPATPDAPTDDAGATTTKKG